jgi:hypothetical protein
MLAGDAVRAFGIAERDRGAPPPKAGGCPQQRTAEPSNVAIAMASLAANLTASPLSASSIAHIPDVTLRLFVSIRPIEPIIPDNPEQLIALAQIPDFAHISYPPRRPNLQSERAGEIGENLRKPFGVAVNLR